MGKNGLAPLMKKAVAAATRRSRELARLTHTALEPAGAGAYIDSSVTRSSRPVQEFGHGPQTRP